MLENEQRKANQFRANLDEDSVLSNAVISIGSYRPEGSVDITFADDVANKIRTKLLVALQSKNEVKLSIDYLDDENNVRSTVHFKGAKCTDIEFDSLSAESDYDLTISTTFSFDYIETTTNESE